MESERAQDWLLRLSDEAEVRWRPDCCVSLAGSDVEFSSSDESFVLLLQAFARWRRASAVISRFPPETGAEMMPVVEELRKAGLFLAIPVTTEDPRDREDGHAANGPCALGIASDVGDASASWCQIQTTTICNFRCWYCPVSHNPRRKPMVMSMEKFTGILDALAKTIARRQLPMIAFAEYNEPTLDPHFTERLLVLKERGFTYYWFSNGSHMTPELVRFLVQERPLITPMRFNLASLEPARLAHLVGIAVSAAEQAITWFMDFLSHSTEFPRGINIIHHGDCGEDHARDFRRSCEAVAKFPNVRVHMEPVASRAGAMKDVGPQVDHGTDNLSCAAGNMRNLYVGLRGNVYLCSEDFGQQTTYGAVEEEGLFALLLGPRRHEAFGRLRSSLCRFCEKAVPIQDSHPRDCR